jgi:peptidoglycan lytic transglycosylase
MPIKSSSSATKRKTPLRIYLLAAVSSVVWVAGVVTVFFTQTVHADTSLPRPLATLPPTPPAVLAPTPVILPKVPAWHRLRGFATWYGEHFHGRKTASGETYDMNAMTACHPTLPFGSVVRVKNLRNHRSVVVRITDRGDLIKGRIIDLSYAAAQQLKMTEAGVAPVALEVLALGGSRSSQ